jgi:LysR family transcriptional regulator for metE and metH
LTEAIVEMVKGGLGVAVLARWAVTPQVEAGTVVTVPLTKRGIQRQWSAATLRSQSSAPYLNKFLSLISNKPLTNSIR